MRPISALILGTCGFGRGKNSPANPFQIHGTFFNKASTLNLQKIIKTFFRFWNDSIG